MEMHCIVLPVKFEGGLSISVLRNEQLFTKIGGSKPNSFQKVKFSNLSTPAIWKKDRPSFPLKVSFFLGSLPNGIDSPVSNST
jgi:hypothetical protein